jgi:N-acyl-D-aspartate/D-glutamate deacylase
VWRRQLELLTEANAAGLTMRAQVAPRAVGVLLGLQCTLNPFLGNPVYQEIAALPLDERVAIMRDPAYKERVMEASRRGDRGLLSNTTKMFELGDPPDYEPQPEASLARRAERAGVDPLDLAYDLLLGDDGRAFLYVPFLNYDDGNLDAARVMLTHPDTVIGLSDGGAHVGTICDASFPTTLLTHWGRDRAEGRLDIPFLVQRQTRATARTVGLLDRGVLAPGYRADVNLIDIDALTARPPEMRYDLPAGGKRLVQGADGYVATLVAGTVTYERGEPTGPLPGRLVRGGRPAPAGGVA